MPLLDTGEAQISKTTLDVLHVTVKALSQDFTRYQIAHAQNIQNSTQVCNTSIS